MKYTVGQREQRRLGLIRAELYNDNKTRMSQTRVEFEEVVQVDLQGKAVSH